MKRIGPLLLLALLVAGCGHKTGAKNLVQTTSTGSAATAVQIVQLEANTFVGNLHGAGAFAGGKIRR